MFTGIIEAVAVVEKLERQENLSVLILRDVRFFKNVVLGESIAINGVCLTVTRKVKGLLYFDLMKETLKQTTLGQLKSGDQVNLERALAYGGRFSGHIVTGHVDGLVKIKNIVELNNYVEFQLELPASFKKFLVLKGSVCLNGISLTVGKVQRNLFSVYLIPYTLKETTMAQLAVGDRMNIEVDILARYMLSQRAK